MRDRGSLVHGGHIGERRGSAPAGNQKVRNPGHGTLGQRVLFCRCSQKGAKRSWQPTAFESELLDRGIELINSRPYHPQTNGNLERFHRSIEEEIFHYESLSRYIEYYNERRLHFSLDIDNYETPLKAFFTKRQQKRSGKKTQNGWRQTPMTSGHNFHTLHIASLLHSSESQAQNACSSAPI